jgi:CDP-glycerol glycerophosphotransferase (TagB/SpsB family)/glycosyltransferase involved in cell wall biosynthesis
VADRNRETVLAARYTRWRQVPLSERSVLYESFYGSGMLDHPEAIFRYLLTQPDMADLEHIWVLDDVEAHAEVRAEFAGQPRVRFVQLESPAYYKALATARYLVNNSTFPQRFAKRAGQVYLNTWHGVPLKHMGFDMPDGGIVSRNVVRNFLNADYLLSHNAWMTDTLYRSAYRLQGVYRGAVLEEGAARVDRQRQAEADPAGALALLESRGVRLAGRRVVLYAPTWRGDSFTDPKVSSRPLLGSIRRLQAELGEGFLVLLKVHQVAYAAMREQVGDCDFLVPNSLPTNVVLGLTDLLVTDYSSIFFDALSSGIPVVHYVPDLEEYRSSRGLYLPEDQLPGPVCVTRDELVAHVREGLAAVRSERAAKAALTYAPSDDGDVCRRVVDVVMRGADESGYRVRRDFGTEKETLLVYLGAMKSMGITTSALNLLRHLDFDRYDVTAFWNYSRGHQRARNAALVDPRVRAIPRAPQLLGWPWRVREENRRLLNEGLPEVLDERHLSFWRDEWQRMFGDARFDHLVDFSGYGCFAPFLFSATQARSKSIWLHNDMMADMQRETLGEKHLEDRLQAVFTTYRHFDHLVSVSPALCRINSTRLASYAPPEKFTYAVNTIDADRVLRGAGLTVEQVRARAAGHAVDTAPGPDDLATFDTRNIGSAVNALLEHFDVTELLVEARGRKRLGATARRADLTTFVSVGRLSPEKNHARLIRAFAQVHHQHPACRLVILGGGLLEVELTELVDRLGLRDDVVVAGQVDNPYSIMADADCFVLSSDYEGQPMVILEARTLGLPVVTTEFSSVGDSVPPDAGLVVPRTVEGVADGLLAFLAGKVPVAPLDPERYNAEAMEQFYRAIGAVRAAEPA